MVLRDVKKEFSYLHLFQYDTEAVDMIGVRVGGYGEVNLVSVVEPMDMVDEVLTHLREPAINDAHALHAVGVGESKSDSVSAFLPCPNLQKVDLVHTFPASSFRRNRQKLHQ